LGKIANFKLVRRQQIAAKDEFFLEIFQRFLQQVQLFFIMACWIEG